MDLLDELKKELEENMENEKSKTRTLEMENKVLYLLEIFFKIL